MVTISVVVIMTPSVFAVWCIVMFTISVVVTMAPSVFAVAPFMLIVVWSVDIMHRSVVWCIWVNNSMMWLGFSWLWCLLWLLWLFWLLLWCFLILSINMVFTWVSVMTCVAIVWKSSVWDSIGHFLSQEDLG